MPEHIQHAPNGFVRASNLYHVGQGERVIHPDKQTTDLELALDLDQPDEGGSE
jgi:hypothetical protein